MVGFSYHLQQVHGKFIFNGAGLDERDAARGGSSKQHMACPLGRYIEDFFIFCTSEKEVKKIYDCVYRALVRKEMRQKTSKCRWPKRDLLAVLGAVCTTYGDIEPNRKK